jgi:tRNA(fMet)-specific endonuclease VapC
MTYLPDTNVCIAMLRRRNPALIARWHATKASEFVLCSVAIYELRYGAERCPNPIGEHAKLDVFLSPYSSLSFDDVSATQCARLRRELEIAGLSIGPHDLQIAAIAMQHSLTLVTHNSREFGRIAGLTCEDWET